MRRWGNAERLGVVQVCTQLSRAEARAFFRFPHGLPCFLPAPSLLSGNERRSGGRQQETRRRERIDYSSPEHASAPHRGTVSDAEAS